MRKKRRLKEKKKVEKIKHGYLLECFDYNPATGDLTWRKRPEYHFKTNSSSVRWNSRYSGKEVGNIDAHGYLCTTINKRPRKVHRLCYFYYHGYLVA